MFTRVFVPLDGSARAEQALPTAARIARATAGTLLLARVVSVAPEFSPYFVLSPAAGPRLTIEVLEEAKDYLTQIARSDVLAGIDSVTVVPTGLAAHALLDEIEKQHADLVVMTSHGRTGLSHWVLGSVAQHVARHSRVPVIVLRENTWFVGDVGTMERPLRVLVPLDGSARAEAILAGLGGLLDDLRVPGGADVRFVCVIDPNELAIAQFEETLVIEGANAYLKRISERLKATYPTTALAVTWSVVVNSDVAGMLIALAEAGRTTDSGAPARSDLVAMATHGRSGFSRWALGSVTERIFGSITVPLLIVRPPDIGQ